MQIVAAPPFIVSSSTASAGTPLTVGDSAGGNTSMTSVTAPRVQFAFGINIQSVTQSPVSNGAGGNLIRVGTKTGFAANLSTGQTMNVSGIITQTNANGTWLITKIDAQTFDLQASTWSAGQGSSGVVGQAILRATTLSINISNSGTFSGFTDLVWCKTADETDVANGLIIDSTLISQLRYLLNPNGVANPDAWLRFMDASGVQSSYENDFSQRIPATYIRYAAVNFRAGYWVGTITNGGSDAYTASNPSSSPASGAYIDGEIVQGNLSATNTAGNPTLALTGRSGGAKPILGSQMTSWIFRVSAAPASAGLVMTWTFTASWLAGLPGVVGTTYTFNYTTVSGDTASVSAFNANLVIALNADTTLAGLTNGRIVFGNSGQVVANPRTAQAGRLTIAYTAGPAIVTMIQVDPSGLSATSGATGGVTFVYNYLADGWVYRAGGMVTSVPVEVILEQANRVGAHVWDCWGITRGSYVTARTEYFRDNLNAGLKYGGEAGNELWNPGANPFPQYQTLGFYLGFTNGSNTAIFNYGALRTIQFAALSKAAWTTTRTASTHYVFQMAQTGDNSVGSNFDLGQLRGTALVTTNATYANYGGLNGTDGSTSTAPSYNASPTRPVDITTAIGMAPYWASPWMGGQATPGGATFGLNNTVAVNAPMLQASLDYANGSTATAFASMANQFNGTTQRATANAAGQMLGTKTTGNGSYYNTFFTSQEAQAAQYDAGRPALGLPPLAIIHYEGGPQWALGASINNGVNSVNSTDISALATRMNSIWSADSVAAYTVSGTDDKTELATQIMVLTQAWKYDASYKNVIKTSYYQSLKTISGANRETKPAQYGYDSNQWGLFPQNFSLGNQYQNYDAIHEFNA